MDIIRVTRSLNAEQTEAAYRVGVFPMGYPERGLITWHQPPRRAILPLDDFHISRSLAHTLKRAQFQVTFNQNFRGVMEACNENRTGSWITGEILDVYGHLHRAGKAHSVEVWVGGELAGGTYGVHLGRAFFAESKFHRVRDMSKVALAHLVQHLRERNFALLDVQYWTEHLSQFGVIEVSAREYRKRLEAALSGSATFSP
jgi:leucyl/phenylalanyl-tRNA---protein transferase